MKKLIYSPDYLRKLKTRLTGGKVSSAMQNSIRFTNARTFNKHEVKDAHRVVLYPKMQRRI
jgi:hypothetical protein